jgi:hypothetical protein
MGDEPLGSSKGPERLVQAGADKLIAALGVAVTAERVGCPPRDLGAMPSLLPAGSSRQLQKELAQRLVERWPTWFHSGGDVRDTAMPRGLAHGDGWFGLLYRRCEDLEPLVAEFEQATGCQFEILQVKEKFGELRIHVNHANDAIREPIEVAEEKAYRTCEVYNQPGKLREDGRIKTLCDQHTSSGATEPSHSGS